MNVTGTVLFPIGAGVNTFAGDFPAGPLVLLALISLSALFLAAILFGRHS